MSKSKIFLSLTAGFLFASAMPVLGQAVPSKESVPQLISAIKSNGSEKQKMDACRQLAIVGGKEAIAALAALLEDEKMSHMARYGLETIPDPAVNEVLRAALPKVKGRLLAGVIGSLGVRKDEGAVPLLAKYLSDTDPVVAQAAARAIGAIGTLESGKFITKAWREATPQNRVAIAEGMLRCAESLLVKNQAAESQAIYDSLRASKEAPQQVRTAAIRGSILARKQGGLALLKECLANSDYAVFAAAARASMEMTGSEVTSALAAELGKGSPDKQMLIARTLGGRHDAAGLMALMAAAQKGDKAVRLDAIRAMGEIQHTGELENLAKLMEDTDKEIAQAAQDIVAGTPGSHADALVLKMLAEPNVGKRLSALDMMGRRRMSASVAALYKVTDDSNARVRGTAIKLAGDLGTPKEIPAVIDFMNAAKVTTDLSAAEQALTVLCEKAGDADGSTAKLTGAMAKAQPQQKSVLVRVLSSVGGSAALKAVRAAVDDPNAEVRSNAIRMLGSWKTADAAPELLALAKSASNADENILFLRGYLTLAANTDIPEPQRLAMCREAAPLVQRNEEKRLLLAALSAIHTGEALQQIMLHVQNKELVEEMAAAVVAVAEKVAQGPQAPRVISPLEFVARSSSNAALVQKAKKILDDVAKKTAK